MAKYQIRELTPQRLGEVRERWRGIAGDDEFDIELAGLFEWCGSHLTHQDGDSQAWELHNRDSDQCDAIVELVASRKGALTKLLKLFLAPSLWNVEANREAVISLYVDAFIEVIKGGLLKGTKDVKLYARNDLMMSLLRSIHAYWQVEGTKAQFQGRFLTISIV